MELNKNASHPRLPGFIGLVRESLQVYRQKWLILLKIVLASYAATALAAAIGIIIAFIASLLVPAHNVYLWVIASTFIVALIVALILASSWFGAATIIVLRDWQESFGVREALRRARPYIMSYLWINIISAILLIPGLILFVIPGLVMLVWFSFPDTLSSLAKKGEWRRF